MHELYELLLRLQRIRLNFPLLHIMGPNGSGKSMLIRALIEEDAIAQSRQYYYIDTENKIASGQFEPDLVRKDRLLLAHLHDAETLHDLLSFPFTMGDWLIIDSLSNVLKETLAHAESFHDRMVGTQFFSGVLFHQLIALIRHYNMFLIVTHHVSYSPLYADLRPYYADLMAHLPGMNIRLENQTLLFSFACVKSPTQARILKYFSKTFPYTISDGKMHMTADPGIGAEKVRALNICDLSS